jgi:hypothetical protein
MNFKHVPLRLGLNRETNTYLLGLASRWLHSLAFQNFKQLRVVIVDGGLGGLAAAVALRRAGHLG